ncbi:thioredoxin-like protein [Piedraia hortae CBS 480.64]|uniref:Thioredoxin-like protein n=1 Tax=Piedraia hortae CBS 480.64 TaxID=1314780 RepID=A0A6A7BY48_9PEZI|nr:thioredoxin-like protein [Piedraia hortae CBS 480.64]
MAPPLEITSSSQLSTITRSNAYTILYFTASWCGPCKSISPIYASLSSSNTVPHLLAFAKIDTDNNRDIAQRFSVSAMPTFIALEGESKTLDTIRGADPSALKSLVERTRKLAEKKGPPGFVGKGRTLGSGTSQNAARQAPRWSTPTASPSTLVRFIGLYLWTLFSLEPRAAAAECPFAVQRQGQGSLARGRGRTLG